MRRPLPTTVRNLGIVSLLTDASSEMIYPLLPAFLTGTLKAGPAFLGLVEGIAEAAASLLKIASGRLSDRLSRRKPLVVAGYAVSSAVRPFVSLAGAPWHVLLIRCVDRVGKGTRSAPRDALLAEVTPSDQRGRAFGFHRAMDNAGAIVGPLLASAVLWWRDDLRLAFALSAVPAAASLLMLVLGVRERSEDRRRPAAQKLSDPVPKGDAATRPTRGLGRYLGVLAIFTLGNSSDAFLLLRAQELGVDLASIPLLWMLHHAVKAGANVPGGSFSDWAGRRNAILAGWGVYAFAYLGFAAATTATHVWLLFALYGLYHALTEGPERALVADLASAGDRGRAFGLYHAVTGAALLPASLLTGLLWQRFGPGAALGTGAVLAAVAALGLQIFVPAASRSSS